MVRLQDQDPIPTLKGLYVVSIGIDGLLDFDIFLASFHLSNFPLLISELSNKLTLHVGQTAPPNPWLGVLAVYFVRSIIVFWCISLNVSLTMSRATSCAVPP